MSQPAIEKSKLPTETLTSHAMLVPWGLFAQRIGLVEALEEVPIPQRRRKHTPQTKLTEFFVSILAGCAYLQDISRGAHPWNVSMILRQLRLEFREQWPRQAAAHRQVVAPSGLPWYHKLAQKEGREKSRPRLAFLSLLVGG
jgi:hypothetical protein